MGSWFVDLIKHSFGWLQLCLPQGKREVWSCWSGCQGRHTVITFWSQTFGTVSLISPKAFLIECTVQNTFAAVKSERTVILLYNIVLNVKKKMTFTGWKSMIAQTLKRSVARVRFHPRHLFSRPQKSLLVTVLERNNFHHFQRFQPLHNVLERTNKPQSFCLYFKDKLNIFSFKNKWTNSTFEKYA